MFGTKSGSATPSDPGQNIAAAAKSDPLTKWATRAIFLLLTLATFSWLDTIKVCNSQPFSFFSSLALKRPT